MGDNEENSLDRGDTNLGRISFVEVARVTTGDIPSVAPTRIDSDISRHSGPPAIFGSLKRELLVLSICTWAPASQVVSRAIFLMEGSDDWFGVRGIADTSA